MESAMLTGGGDCPGLNAVHRAPRCARASVHYGDELLGFHDGWKGVIENRRRRARRRAHAGHAAAGRHDPRLVAHEPVQDRRRRRARARRRWPRTASTRSSPSAARTRSASPTSLYDDGRQRRRRAEDDRQRPVGHRADLRLRHRRADLRRRHRPAAHHGRVARPGDGRRGHGTPRRPHRAVGRHRRRGDDDARSPSSRSTSRRCAQRDPAPPRATAGTPRSWSWPKAPSRRQGRSTCQLGTKSTRSATPASVASAPSPRRSRERTGYETRATSSATCSGAAHRRRFDRVLVDPVRHRRHRRGRTTARSARWSAPAARPHRARAPSRRRSAQLKLVDPALYHGVASSSSSVPGVADRLARGSVLRVEESGGDRSRRSRPGRSGVESATCRRSRSGPRLDAVGRRQHVCMPAGRSGRPCSDRSVARWTAHLALRQLEGHHAAAVLPGGDQVSSADRDRQWSSRPWPPGQLGRTVEQQSATCASADLRGSESTGCAWRRLIRSTVADEVVARRCGRWRRSAPG